MTLFPQALFNDTGDMNEKSSEKGSEKGSDSEWDFRRKKIQQKASTKINKNQWSIIELIWENNGISIQELSEKIGISTRAIEKNLDKLKSEDIISRTGPDKGGLWSLNYN